MTNPVGTGHPPPSRLRTERWISWLVLGAGLLLPAISLIPIGSLWLWQRGYLLHWALGALLCIALWVVLVRRLFPPLADKAAVADPTALPVPPPGDAGWRDSEQLAWADVLSVAATADPASLASRDAALRLALDTITTVSKRLHPEVDDPLWRFTAPEALSIVEQVAARLRRFMDDTIPFSDRLTVAQVLAIYRWRGAIDVLDRAYDVWRIVRLANPVTAATHELRERLSREIVEHGRRHIGRILVEAYVKEVGRAAIDLYGGRLRGKTHGEARPNLDGVDAAELTPAAPVSRVPRVLRQLGKAGKMLARSLRPQRRRLDD